MIPAIVHSVYSHLGYLSSGVGPSAAASAKAGWRQRAAAAAWRVLLASEIKDKSPLFHLPCKDEVYFLFSPSPPPLSWAQRRE